MAHSGNDEGKRRLKVMIEGVEEDEKHYYNFVNLTEERYETFKKECVSMVIGTDMFYVEVPLDLEFDSQCNLNYFKHKKNVRVLERPDEFGRQVFLPGIVVEKVIESPDLPEALLKRMTQMQVIKKQKFIHIQSFLHLIDYWSRTAFLERKREIQDAILKEIRKHKSKKSKELFTKAEAKMIANHILSVRFDITDHKHKELYYTLCTLERLRTFKDETLYTYENLKLYFTRLAFNFVWHKFICGLCYQDTDFAELGGFKSCRYGLDDEVVTLTKEEMLNQLIHCCKKCFEKV